MEVHNLPAAPQSITLARDPAGTSWNALVAVAGLSGWLAYTFSFPALQHAHLTAPTCPFLLLTGHPCPFCGATRSFSAVWRGDVARALHLYPLGPLLFVATVVAIGSLVLLLATRRTVRFNLSGKTQVRIGLVVGAVLAAQWAMKLFWLGNT